MAPRIGLIHAVRVSIGPTDEAFARLWPEAGLQHLLDDGLAPDLRVAGAITPAINRRFVELATYLAGCGAHGILYTCSAFGTAIEFARRTVDLPVLKPNEAMIEEAVRSAGRIGLIATDPPAIRSMVPEIEQISAANGRAVEIHTACAPDAMAALREGRPEAHDGAVARVAGELPADCEVVVLAQFSMARARPVVEAAHRGRVLTSPDSAVKRLKELVGGRA
jgi:Asp/Glu/hydantoin racemase